MGVCGLTTFVERNHRKLYTKEKLQNCSLVIDGFGLLYNLYFGSSLDSRLGGEYAAFAEVIRKFFDELKLCRITPYVIFDGPTPAEKCPCVLQRLQSRIIDVHNMFKTGSNARVLPLFAASVLQQTLKELHIPYVFTMVEADPCIAAIANHLKCPVLALDSDYYIFNIEHGYLPLTHFEWQECFTTESLGRYIPCQRYHISSMTREYGVTDKAIWLISVLLGNDYIQKDTFLQLLSKIPKKRSTSKSKKMKKKSFEERVDLVLDWVSTKYTDTDSIVDKLRVSLPKNQRKSVIDKVEKSMMRYTALPGMLDELDIMKIPRPDASTVMSAKKGISFALRKGGIHPFMYEALHLHQVCLPVIVSNPRKPSPHDSSSDIRELIYKIISRNEDTECGHLCTFWTSEYDKEWFAYKAVRNIKLEASVCPSCMEKHSAKLPCPSTAPSNTDEGIQQELDIPGSSSKATDGTFGTSTVLCGTGKKSEGILLDATTGVPDATSEPVMTSIDPVTMPCAYGATSGESDATVYDPTAKLPINSIATSGAPEGISSDATCEPFGATNDVSAATYKSPNTISTIDPTMSKTHDATSTIFDATNNDSGATYKPPNTTPTIDPAVSEACDATSPISGATNDDSGATSKLSNVTSMVHRAISKACDATPCVGDATNINTSATCRTADATDKNHGATSKPPHTISATYGPAAADEFNNVTDPEAFINSTFCFKPWPPAAAVRARLGTSFTVALMKLFRPATHGATLPSSPQGLATVFDIIPKESYDALMISLLFWQQRSSPKPTVTAALVLTIVTSIFLHAKSHREMIKNGKDLKLSNQIIPNGGEDICAVGEDRDVSSIPSNGVATSDGNRRSETLPSSRQKTISITNSGDRIGYCKEGGGTEGICATGGSVDKMSNCGNTTWEDEDQVETLPSSGQKSKSTTKSGDQIKYCKEGNGTEEICATGGVIDCGMSKCGNTTWEDENQVETLPSSGQKSKSIKKSGSQVKYCKEVGGTVEICATGGPVDCKMSKCGDTTWENENQIKTLPTSGQNSKSLTESDALVKHGKVEATMSNGVPNLTTLPSSVQTNRKHHPSRRGDGSLTDGNREANTVGLSWDVSNQQLQSRARKSGSEKRSSFTRSCNAGEMSHKRDACKVDAIRELLDAISPPVISASGSGIEEDSPDYDIDLIHGSAEWQCTLYWIRMYCQAYGTKGWDVPIQVLLAGNKLLHKVYTRVRRLADMKECVGDLGCLCRLLAGRTGRFLKIKASFEVLSRSILEHCSQ